MHHHSNLTDDQVRQMRAMYKPWVCGYSVLAKEFGCVFSTALDICTYRTRRDVT